MRGSDERVSFVQHDITSTPFPIGRGDLIFSRFLLSHLSDAGCVAREDYASEAPADPDVRISRIRLFSPRFRYATIARRMRGAGSG